MNQRLGWFSLFFWSPHGLVRIVGLASWLRHSNTKIDTSWQFPLHMASKIILTQSNNHPRFFAENQTNPKCPLVMCVGGMCVCVCGGGCGQGQISHPLLYYCKKSWQWFPTCRLFTKSNLISKVCAQKTIVDLRRQLMALFKTTPTLSLHEAMCGWITPCLASVTRLTALPLGWPLQPPKVNPLGQPSLTTLHDFGVNSIRGLTTPKICFFGNVTKEKFGDTIKESHVYS